LRSNLIFVLLDPYPVWPCGDIVISFKSIPENWPKSQWAWHNSTSFKVKGTIPGKVIYRVCKGCIICTNFACLVRIRPQVRANGMGISKQIEKNCPSPGCGSKLVWQRCEAKCYWTTLETPDHDGHIAILKHKG